MAISTSYLNAAGFLNSFSAPVFSAPVISQIESIGAVGWEGNGVGDGGEWGAVGGLKHPFGLKEQVLCLQYVT